MSDNGSDKSTLIKIKKEERKLEQHLPRNNKHGMRGFIPGNKGLLSFELALANQRISCVCLFLQVLP